MKLVAAAFSILLSLVPFTSFADIELDAIMICQDQPGEKLTLYTYYDNQVSDIAALVIEDQKYIGAASNHVDRTGAQTIQTMAFQSKDENVTGTFINDSSGFAGGVQFKDSGKVINFQKCWWNDVGGGSISVHN